MSSKSPKIFPALLVIMTAVGGCAKKGSRSNDEPPQAPPPLLIDGGSIIITPPKGQIEDNTIVIDQNSVINLTVVNGVKYVPLEGTFDETSFTQHWQFANQTTVSKNEAIAYMDIVLDRVFKSLKQENFELSDIKKYPKVGYFTGLLPLDRLEALSQADLKLPGNVLVAPIVTHKGIGEVKVLNASPNTNRDDLEGFSGLRPMGVFDFLEKVKKDIGNEIPTGKNVTVGVTDTGVSYNHPAFKDDNGNFRIQRMRDYTNEGKVFFDLDAQFNVKSPTPSMNAPGDTFETMLITAEYLKLVTTSGSFPKAKDFDKITDAKILLSSELAQKLNLVGNKAKLAIVSEEQYGSRVDLNFNGNRTDRYFQILIPRGDSYEIYMSAAFIAEKNTLDFRKSIAVGDFASTKETMKLVAEKFGFDIRPAKLKDASDKEIPVIQSAIVGFDTAGHGSHVTGIIGGRKYIQNIEDSSLSRGVVPNANLMVNRVCAVVGGCYNWNSAIIDLADSGAEIINMSLGGLSANNDEFGIGQQVIDRLTMVNNVLFMISAGNSGPNRNTVGTPSTSKYALSVAATATNKIIERQYQWPSTGKLGSIITTDPHENFVMDFSSRGPTASGGMAPDISAPGTELSAFPLNTSGTAGLSVIWGTSMASPAAAGAAALLLDAAKIYNKKYPNNPLPIDSLTLRKVLLESAKPFNATTFNSERNIATHGLYSWIDQGAGMINLPAAWEALKAEKSHRLPSSVRYEVDGTLKDINLDYTVQVRAKLPNGLDYSGTVDIDSKNPTAGKKIGQGIWINPSSAAEYYRVSLSRNLPSNLTESDSYGDLWSILTNTADTFKVETTMYGSHVDWLKVGTLRQTNCVSSPTTDRWTVIGRGSLAASELVVCVDKAKFNTLTPGDHGALIKAYKMDEQGNIEKNATVIIPVYVTISEKTLAGESSYQVSGAVQSFGVKRHYVNVPTGATFVKVTLTVPPSRIADDGSVQDCSAVSLTVNEGENIKTPPEINTKSVAQSCYSNGGVLNDTNSRTVSFSRSAPKSGIWDLSIFGIYAMPVSMYTLRVDFAHTVSSKKEIKGNIDSLNNHVIFEVKDNSLTDTKLSKVNTSISLDTIALPKRHSIKLKEDLIIPSEQGVATRQFSSDITSVTVSTAEAPGSDIDLYVESCKKPDGTECTAVGSSRSDTDIETYTFNSNPSLYYKFIVKGYALANSAQESGFTFSESRTFKDVPKGSISIEELGQNVFKINHNLVTSPLLSNQSFLNGKAQLSGNLNIGTEKDLLLRIPITISL